MAKRRKGAAGEEEDELEVGAQAPGEAAAEEPKSEGDLTQEEIDEKIVAEVKEAVHCATGAVPTVKLTPEQATRLLALAGFPLGE